MSYTRYLAIVAFLFIPFMSSSIASDKGIFSLFVEPSPSERSSIGVGLYQWRDTQPGFYFNLQASGEPPEYYDSLSMESFGDPVVKRFRNLHQLSVGLTWPLADNLMGYTGIGAGSWTGYARLRDPTTILGDQKGEYHVRTNGDDASGGNAAIGLMLAIPDTPVVLQTGYNSFSDAVFAGLGWEF